MNKKTSPLVSVVMSVYNGEKYLREAIESILNQTFTDFEFIIINDGSTDDTLKIIKSYKDLRIVLIDRENKGLVASLNEGINVARGKYIARQDADDWSVNTRLAKQVEYLEGNSEAVVVGSWITIIDDKSTARGVHRLYTEDIDIKRELLLRSPFAHGSIMAVKSKLPARYGIYDDKFYPAEDYALWSELSQCGVMYNLAKPLYSYRDNFLGISQTNTAKQKEAAKLISESNIRDRAELFKPYSWRRYKGNLDLRLRQYNDSKQIVWNFLKNRMYMKSFFALGIYFLSFSTMLPIKNFSAKIRNLFN